MGETTNLPGATPAPETPGATALNAPMRGLSPGMQSMFGQMRGQAQERDRLIGDVAQKTRAAEEQRGRTMGQAYDTLAQTQREAARPLEDMGPPPAFVPTRENAGDLATLFSLLAVAGTAMGGKAKGGAMSAMSSMTGMLNGWRQGRQDLYERERKQFEASLQQFRAQQEQLKGIYDRAMRVAQTDLQRATTQAESELKAAGADIAAQTLRVQGLPSSFQVFQEQMKAVQAAEQRAATIAQQAPQVVRMGDQWVYAQRRGDQFIPIKGPDGQPMTAPPPAGSPEYLRAVAEARRSGSSTAADRFGFGDIIATASNEAAAEIANLVELAEESTSGIFQGRNTTGLLNAPLGALVNQLTSEEAQRYNITINNFGKFLAQVQKGGRVVGQREMAAAAEPFIIREGDTPMTVLTRIAAMRQGLERAIEVRLASPNTPDTLKSIYQQNLNDIQRAIPFTVSDVNRFLSQGDQRRTFTDMIRESGVTGQSGQREAPAGGAQAPAANEGYVLNGRRIVVRDNRWVFEDDGSPAQ